MKRTTRRAKQHARQQGAVMLIVMLVLLTATAMASVSLQATQSELRAAGNHRIALQTQYAAEAAMNTTLAWVDATSLSGDFYVSQLRDWQFRALDGTTGEGGPPQMWRFGEPEIDPDNRNFANRTQWSQQRGLPFQTAPLTVANGAVAPAGSNVQQPDPIGSFGPRSQYVPGFQSDELPATLVDYVVDMYDCQQSAVTATEGTLINDIGSGVPRSFQVYCVITSRGRSYLPYPVGADATQMKSVQKEWKLDNVRDPYVANRFVAAHDARGTLVTPPMLQ